MALVCDTGPLLAGLDRDDPDHQACAELLGGAEEDLVVPGLVLAELDYWCRKLGLEAAWLDFLEDVDAGAWRLEQPSSADVQRARVLIETYHDLSLGMADASVVTLVERLDETKVASLDKRHFSVVRPVHTEGLVILP